jgi:hypothetical protein
VHISLHAVLLALLAAGTPGEAGLRARLDAGLPDRAPGAPRATWAASLLLGAPYRTSPLGEGPGADRDPDPRFRLDAFDCVTLVETAMALGAATSVADAERLLDGVRYDGAPSWTRRAHYPESQWLPSLLRKGWLEPLGADDLGVATARVVKRLDAAAWIAAERSGRAVPGLGEADRPTGEFALEVVPLDRLLQAAPRIPEGAVLLVVREPRAARPSLVTHMGLVVARADGSRALRHASDVPGVMRVRDEPLEAVVRRFARKSWPVAGVAAFRMRAPVTDR